MHPSSSSTTSGPARALLGVLVALVAAAATIATIFALGRATGSVQEHGVALMAAAAVALPALWFGLRGSSIRLFAVGGVVGTLLVAVVLGGLSARPSEVDEQVVRASGGASRAGGGAGAPSTPSAEAPSADEKPDSNVLLASGKFEPLEHAGRGTASLIRTTDGRDVLTLTGFSTDAGPDLFVWLVRGDPKDDSDVEAGSGHLSLGRLKGTSGNQQYVLPRGADPADYTHAYVWCRAFSVGFTRARLA